jgi:tellurite resistance protein
MALSQQDASRVLVQALAKAQARGVFEIHESALVHEALTLLGPKLGLVADHVPVVQNEVSP